MPQMVLCQFHEERTPSCAVYSNGYKCFGCGKFGPLSDLGMTASEVEPKYVEDIEKSIQQIISLPKKEIRGLDLHSDSNSYYIVWPDHSYYKKRYINPHHGKYQNPSGHS